MAVNDAEIKIGVSLDADQFTNAYNNLLSKTSQTTQGYIQNALDPDNMKGAATKNWDLLPYAKMHDPAAGNIMATQAFMSSFAEDMHAAGIRRNSLGWQSGLLSAAYKSSIPDPMERYHKLLSEGVAYYQADEVYPTTALSKMIESDYALMEQDWSRDFIKTRTRKGEKSQYIDFAGMRDYAVKHGLGRWIDEDGEKTADNFELINDELENIVDNSEKSENLFKGWGDSLKGVLGTLTAIGALAGISKTFEVAYKASEKGTVEAGTTLDRRRAYVGMSALDELSAQVASQSVGLGKDAITNEIITMSSNREKYQLLGEGLNALYPSLTGIFDNIMSSENPMETYKSILKEVYDNMRGADQDTRAQTLMLLESQGLGSAAQVIGAMLSNDKLAKELDYDPTNLFTLRNNSYYGAFEQAETVLPDLAQLNASLQASYSQMYTDWETAFGIPFKTWWDDVMKNKIIPWFERMIEFMGIGKSEAWKAVDEATSEIAMVIGLPGMGGALDERNRLIEKKSARAAYAGYKAQIFGAEGVNLGSDRWNTILSGNMRYKGDTAFGVWQKFNEVLDTSEEKLQGHPTALATRNRIAYMIDKLNETGLSAFLKNTKNEDVDAYLLQALQMGAAGGTGWQSNFDAYIDKVLKIGLEGKQDDEILAALEKIAKNTEQREELFKKDDLWMIIEATYGSTVAAQWKDSLNRQ